MIPFGLRKEGQIKQDIREPVSKLRIGRCVRGFGINIKGCSAEEISSLISFSRNSKVF
jgi:hypothetical protein